jgi:hypothetical protein
MNKFTLSFLALSRSINLEIESANSIDEITSSLMYLFVKEIDYENFKIEIESLQQNTSDFRAKLNDLIEKYKDVKPEIQQLNSYFKTLKDNEYFFVFPAVISKDQSYYLCNYLLALEQNEDYGKFSEQMDELFGHVRYNYEMSAFDENTRTKIGEQDKSKRICRYCNKDNSDVKFRKVAHTISEALGNKKIITNDECDTCNEKFGSGIENDLILYLNLYRTVFGIKGKNGVPKLKGKNFEIENKGTIEIKHTLTDEEINDPNRDDFKVRLETNQDITAQNIYRTLSKYALGVIDRTQLVNFQETIEWINGDKNFENLPKLKMLLSYELFSTHPKMVVYLRKNDNYKLPFAVVELRFTFLTFVYIIPKSSKDEKDFTQSENFEEFWIFFKHYSSVKNWKSIYLNDSTAKKFVMNMNFEKRQDEEKSE